MARHVVAVPVVVIGLLVASRFFVVPESALGYTYTSSILGEFAAGVLVGKTLTRYSFRAFWPLLPLGVVGLAAVEFVGEMTRGLSQGLPALAIVVGALALERAGKLPKLGLLRQIGDSSYSLYLSHSFVSYALVVLWRRLPLQGWSQYLTFVPVLLTASVLVALLVHRLIEKPMTRYLSRISMRHLRPKQVSDVA